MFHESAISLSRSCYSKVIVTVPVVHSTVPQNAKMLPMWRGPIVNPVSKPLTFCMSATQHYDQSYFSWQQSLGEFSAKANFFRFAPYVRVTDRVIDFGCGGGHLLSVLRCADRRGIEVNPIARVEAERRGVKCVAGASDLPDEWADVVISNSALEHTEDPLTELRQLLPKVRRGGLVIFCVPHETTGWRYKPNDINQHLYTWSPMALGNLFTTAGFSVAWVKSDKSLWPPHYERIYNVFGEIVFRAICKLYRWARLGLSPLKTFPTDATIVVLAHRSSE